MALTDLNPTPYNQGSPVFDPAPAAHAAAPSYRAALDALPRLQAEARGNHQLGLFLSRSSAACMVLLVIGAATLFATAIAGGGTLKADFAWAVLVLLGVVAMTRNYIRGFARSLRRVPLAEAASDLRALLLYTGAAWASGAYLLMPDNPAPALVFSFAALPSLALALSLKDRAGILAFTLPVTLATAGAALLGAWPMAFGVASATLAFAVGIACLPGGRTRV